MCLESDVKMTQAMLDSRSNPTGIELDYGHVRRVAAVRAVESAGATSLTIPLRVAPRDPFEMRLDVRHYGREHHQRPADGGDQLCADKRLRAA